MGGVWSGSVKDISIVNRNPETYQLLSDALDARISSFCSGDAGGTGSCRTAERGDFFYNGEEINEYSSTNHETVSMCVNRRHDPSEFVS
jgi:hypothetical protein